MKKIISTSNAPAAIGPYSQAVAANGFLFMSGQIPIDPKTGSLIDGDVGAQTKQVLSNMEAVLLEAGTSFKNVVRTTIFLKSMDDFAVVNKIYGERFATQPPARATVEVSRLPLNVLVEISAVALLS